MKRNLFEDLARPSLRAKKFDVEGGGYQTAGDRGAPEVSLCCVMDPL